MMKHTHLSWPQAKNRLAAGVYHAVSYQNGKINSYVFEDDKIFTCVKHPSAPKECYQREPMNPHYLFKALKV